jgi:hypothetical protein
MNCKCRAAGYCHTHQREMSDLRWKQCQNEPGVFEAFQSDLHKRSPSGLGDTIAQITRATGINRAVHAVAKWLGR